MIDREQYQRASAIFMQACDLPAHERHRWVQECCGDDAYLRTLVLAMLEADESTPSDATSAEVRVGLEAVLTGGETTERVVRQCGPYTLGRLLGRGGMGEVYEATRSNPTRQVALKLLHRARSSPASLRRFRREVASLARLSHPGISQFYEAGVCQAGGVPSPYFAMELVRGEPITTFAQRRNLTLVDTLGLIAQLCDIVQFAHQQGVIHRDLKPSNILVTETDAGEAAVKILDFGIAHLLDDTEPDATKLTEQGMAMGTPGFMAPEQVRSEAGAVDTRADVYAIGAIAYLLLSGKPSLNVEGLSTFDAIKRVLEDDPAPLASLEPRLRGDISLVVATAMQKERNRRYASAAELGLELRRITRHEPVQAREPSAAYLLSRFARRHRALVTAAAASLVALICFAAVVTVMYRREQQQRLLTEMQRERADAEARMQKEISGFLVADTLGAAAPSRKGASLKVIDVIDDAARAVDERFATDQVLRGKVRAMIANLFFGIARYQEAAATAAQAIAELRDTSVEHEVYFADLLRFHAAALESTNRQDESLVAYREAIRVATGLGEAGLTSALFATAGLGELLQARGQHAEAQPLLRSLMETMPQQVTAPSNPDLVTAMVSVRISLAASLSATGAPPGEERLQLLQTAVDIGRAGLPSGHPAMLSSLGSLASLLASIGRASEAMPLSIELLASLEKSFPEDHPSVGMALLSAAMAHSAAGQHRQACDFASRGLAVFQH